MKKTDEVCIEHVDSAGVIPYFERDGKYYFILGREQYRTKWMGSRKWAAFAGRSTPNETALQTSAREFHEESLGLIRSSHTKGWTATARELIDDLNNAQLRMHLTYIRAGIKKTNVTYLLKVEFDSSLTAKFAHLRHELSFLQHQASLLQRYRDNVTFSFPFLEEGMITNHRGSSRTVDEVKAVELHENSLLVVVVSSDSSTHVHDTLVVDVSKHEARRKGEQYTRWFEKRVQIEKELSQIENCILTHPAVKITRSTKGKLKSIHIDKSFMEKTEMKAWHEDDLTRVLRSGGHSVSGDFRLYLLPAIMIALNNLMRARRELKKTQLKCPSKLAESSV